MTIPKLLKIGAHTYEIKRASHWKDVAPNTLGETFYDTRTIFIKDDLADTEAFSTLVHEIMHVINRTLDHTLLDSLSEQIAQVLIDNRMVH